VHSTAGRWFRYAAIAETVSWVGLLIGMFFKYIAVHNDIGVYIFGRVHGAMFVFYGVTMLWAARVLRWSFLRLALGGAASIPPFLGLIFERWIDRKVAAESASAAPVAAPAAAVG
jgi:integral membrane protein